MSGTFKMVQLVGTSPESFAKAADNAVRDAAKTLRNLSWFEVVEMRGGIADGAVKEFQVKVNVGFKLER